MAEIFTITLRSDYGSRFKFHHDGGPLPGDMRVSDENGGSWKFKCTSEGGGWFTISGSGWRNFFNSYSIRDIVILSNQADYEVYTFSVR
ncbi:hypothetical protein V6N13_018285 [Hibiscus sabdariffa]|uniref:TF-B3 domain-containing protein n=1 Tax=Hibiscus sabdariffa TaxID=183260 RepID=A0ABR2EMG2_9ROSI